MSMHPTTSVAPWLQAPYPFGHTPELHQRSHGAGSHESPAPLVYHLRWPACGRGYYTDGCGVYVCPACGRSWLAITAMWELASTLSVAQGVV